MSFSMTGSDLRLILQLWLVVEVEPGGDMVNAAAQHRLVLVNWQQMLGSFDSFARESGSAGVEERN